MQEWLKFSNTTHFILFSFSENKTCNISCLTCVYECKSFWIWRTEADTHHQHEGPEELGQELFEDAVFDGAVMLHDAASVCWDWTGAAALKLHTSIRLVTLTSLTHCWTTGFHFILPQALLY